MAAAVTGYKISGGTDLNNVFASYESGPQAAVTGYKISGGADLNTVFAPYVSGPQALATGYNSSFGDLNQAFARLKQWSQVGGGTGGGFNKLSGSCRTLAFDSLGNLYAGGAFTTANGSTTACNNIAKLAVGATAWTPVGSGINSTVYIIAIDISNNIYAGGGFTTANGENNTQCNRIAKLVGTEWTPVGTGTGGGFSGIVYGLACDSSKNVYAGGDFLNANGVSRNRIAKLQVDTTVWEAVGNGAGGGFNNVVGYIAIDSSNNVYAGGHFTTANGASTTACNRIAKLVSSAWEPVGTGTGGGFNDFVYGLACDSSNNVYACGGFTGANGTNNTSCNRIAKFSSTVGTTAWAQVGSGAGGGFNGIVYGVACDLSNNVYALGGFTGANKSGPSTIPCNRIAKFPVGTTDWAQVGGGVGSGVGGGFNQANGLHAAVDSSGNIYACGSFTTANTTSGSFTCNYVAKCS
jgi:hypothetical protein